MLEETGVVVEKVHPDRVKVKVARSAACEGCASAAVCQVMADGKEMLVEACDNVGVKVGQQVVIAVEERTLLWASFMVYVLPLVGLFLGASLAQWGTSSTSEAWVIGGGLLGLMLGFLIVYRHSQSVKANEYLPVVVRVAEGKHS